MTSQNSPSKKLNIVFDLGGVLFELHHPETLQSEKKLFSPLADGVALLEDCFQAARRDGHKLFVCSNLSMGYIEMLEQDFPQIFKLFDGVVTPTVAQAKKPDTKIFKYLLDTYELIPHHSVFIDDQLPNVEGAKSLGMLGIHMKDFQHVRSELQRHGVL